LPVSAPHSVNRGAGWKPEDESTDFFYGRVKGPCGVAAQMKKCGQRGQVTASTLAGKCPPAMLVNIWLLFSRRLFIIVEEIVTNSVISSVKCTASTE